MVANKQAESAKTAARDDESLATAAPSPEQEAAAGKDPTPEASTRHAELSDEVRGHQYRYYVLDAPTGKQVAERVSKLWQRLGFPAARLPQQVVITPACGLAGASEPYARAVLAACREAGRRLAEG